MTFKDMVQDDKMRLIVSLPKNDIEFARAAWLNGADAIKVHINAEHFASGTSFKSMSEEHEVLKEILDESPVPVGIVIGEDTQTIIDDFQRVLAEDFQFMSVYYDVCPTVVLDQDKILKTVALNSTFNLSSIDVLSDIGIEALELSVLNHDEYGDLLTVKDLMTYKSIINTIDIPVIVPSQKKILVSDLKSLQDIGVKFVMIGAVVTGNELDNFSVAIKEFSEELKNN